MNRISIAEAHRLLVARGAVYYGSTRQSVGEVEKLVLAEGDDWYKEPAPKDGCCEFVARSRDVVRIRPDGRESYLTRSKGDQCFRLGSVLIFSCGGEYTNSVIYKLGPESE